MRPPPPSKKRDPDKGLRTERQIQLYRLREAAKRDRAERREAEARVRYSNFQLVQAAVLLAVAVLIGVAFVIGLLANQQLLKFAVPAAGAWGALAAALYRWRPKQREKAD
jgi:hypothetical protein